MIYEDLTFNDLGTKRQRPMFLSAFTKFRKGMDMKTYPDDPHAYTKYFLEEIDTWIHDHKWIQYRGLDNFPVHEAIHGTTHTLDELHYLHKRHICVFEGEYRYHERLLGAKLKKIKYTDQISFNDVLVVSYPSCITTNYLPDFDKFLDRCYMMRVPVHIDGAWFGQCRNFYFNVNHPAIQSVSVSLSKALGMGSNRIGIRYSREKVQGPISIMNDYNYCNVSDMWIGVAMMKHYGPDYWWKNYSKEYTKVCNDFGLKECDSIHLGMGDKYYGIRTPLRMLIEKKYDERGTDRGLNDVERNEE